MMDHENTWDLSLRIKTTGRDETNADEYHHPYEPTPYSVLERLVDSGFFRKDDVVLDYGCGKGRVGFFLSYRTKASTIGIEYDDRIYESALENRKSTISRVKPDFVLTRAEEYEVPPEVNRCYFFNPFSVEILHAVCARIVESWYDSPREVFLLFYYPADEYISYLMTVDELEFYDEIECDDLFEGNDPRERIIIFQLPYYEAECQEHFDFHKEAVERVKQENACKDDFGHSWAVAYTIAEDTVEAQLKAPSTADFSNKNETAISVHNNVWIVSGWVEAQNSFGATIRNTYTVQITFTSVDKYTVDFCRIN